MTDFDAIWALDRAEEIADQVAIEFGTGAGQEAAYRHPSLLTLDTSRVPVES